MKIKKVIILLILIMIIFFLPVKAENYGGQLKIKVNQRPFNLNPIHSSNKTELLINSLIFDTLIKYNSEGEIVPNLAESWEINSNSDKFIFKLRKNIYFHEYSYNNKKADLKQRKVKAEDWKWSLEYLADPKNKSPYAELLKKIKGYYSYRKGESQGISGIKILNDYTLEINLKESYAPFLNNFLENSVVVIPKEVVNQKKKIFSLAPIGTGAFKFNNLLKDTIKLSRNNNFWLNNYQNTKLPYLNEIEIVFGRNSGERLNYQDFDLYQLNNEEFTNFQKNKSDFKNYNLKKVLDKNIFFISLDYKDTLNNNFTNLKKIINENFKKDNKYEKYNAFIKFDIASESYPLLDKIYNSNLKSDCNLIKEETISVNTTEKFFDQKFREKIEKDFQKNNLKLKIKQKSWIEYLNFLNNKDLNKGIFIYPYKYTNNFNFIYENFYSEAKLNYANYNNERVDKMIRYLIIENKPSNIEQALEVICSILNKNNPTLLFSQGSNSYLVSKRIENIDNLTNIYLKNQFELLYFKKNKMQ